MDSVRENRTKDDIITEILLEISADLENQKCILLVEGSDDIKFAERVFSENLLCIESFSGKEGLKELIEDSSLQKEWVIAVRDRDYMDISRLPQRMFLYDKCCMELMLLSNKKVAESFHQMFYAGIYEKEIYITNAMRILAPYSVLRRKNEHEARGIPFDKVGFGDLVQQDGDLDTQKVFGRLRLDSEVFSECREEANHICDEGLWNITNGHDLCLYLGTISRLNKGNLGETGVRKILLGCYRKEDFKETELYHAINTYQANRNLRFVD